jgi:hypothetical protein
VCRPGQYARTLAGHRLKFEVLRGRRLWVYHLGSNAHIRSWGRQEIWDLFCVTAHREAAGGDRAAVAHGLGLLAEYQSQKSKVWDPASVTWQGQGQSVIAREQVELYFPGADCEVSVIDTDGCARVAEDGVGVWPFVFARHIPTIVVLLLSHR